VKRLSTVSTGTTTAAKHDGGCGERGKGERRIEEEEKEEGG